MATETIWKLDIQPGDSQTTLKALESRFLAIKQRIQETVSAGQGFDKLSSFQAKAAEAGKRLEVAQAQAALALKKAQDAATGGKASAEQVAVAQARAALSAQRVQTAQNAVAVALGRAQAAMQAAANATRSGASSFNLFARAAEVARSALGGMASGLGSAINGVGGLGSRLVGTIGSLVNFGSKLGMTVFGIKSLIDGAVSLGQALLAPGEALEQARTAFTAFTHNLGVTNSLIARLRSLDTQSPFQLPGIEHTALELLNMNVQAKDVPTWLGKIGNAVAKISGNDDVLEGVTLALQQMSTKGHIMSEEMMQLTERNIPAWELLAKAMHVTTAQLQEMVTRGEVGRDKIALLVDAMGKWGNGAMVAQGETMQGILSSIHDGAMQAWEAFSGSAFHLAEGNFRQLRDLVGSPAFQQFAQQMGDKVGNALQQLGSFINGTAIPAVQNFLHTLQPLLDAFQSPAFLDMEHAFEDLGTAISDRIMPYLTPMVTQFLSLFSNSSIASGASGLEQAFSGIAGAVHGLADFISGLPVLFGQIQSAMAPVVGFLVSTFKPAWDQLVTTFQTQLMPSLTLLWENLQPLMPAFTFLGQVIGGVVVGALVVLLAMLNGVVQGFVGLLVGVTQAIGGIVQIVSGGLQVAAGLVALIVDFFTGHFERMGTDLTAIFGGVIRMFAGGWNLIQGIFNAGSGLVLGFMQGFSNALTGIFRALFNILVGHSIIPDMVAAIVAVFAGLPARSVAALSGMIGMIGGFFGNLAAQAISWGAHVVENVAAGIRNGISSVASAIGSVTQFIADHLPHSPAKIGPLRDLHKQGTLITEQISAGMLANLPRLNAALGAITTPITANLTIPGAFGGQSGDTSQVVALLANILDELRKGSSGALTVNANVTPGSLDAQRLNALVQSLSGLNYEGVQRGAW